MILITGGRGAVATQLQSLLLQTGHPVRVASKNPDELQLPDGVPAIACDLKNPATFPAALSGITAVFLYAEASHIAEFIDAAGTAGVEHVVLLSSAAVLKPDAADDPLAKSHRDVETALLTSALTTTLLRPGSFAGNARAWAWPIKAGRPVSLPYPGSHSDPIHERDVAEVAHTVLTDPRHQGRHLHLTGPESLTFSEQIDQLAKITGQSITVNHVTREEWKQETADFIPVPYADALLNYWRSCDGCPVPLTGTVEELTGHAARTFAVWAHDHATDFVS
jgi:uncharacterized protein YbjT (DUF2867 family)